MPQPIDSIWAVKPEFLASLTALKDYPETTNWTQAGYRVENGVATIEVTGVLTRYASVFQEIFGGAATDEISKQFASAMLDTNVKAIVFDIDSPGGQIAGIPQLSDQIFNARGKGKTLIAQCDGTLASAAYYIASQCDKVYASHITDEIGSIGTVCCFYDHSKAMEREGVEAVVIASGPLKGIGIHGAPITDEQRTYLTNRMEGMTGDFRTAVERGRGMLPEAVKAIATGEAMRATEAKQLGLIDGIQSLDTTLAMLAGSSSSKRKGRNMAGATYAELKAECVGASAEFLISCLDSGIDAGQARANWQAKQNQEVAAMLAENVKLKADLATAQASIGTLTAEVAKLKKPGQFVPAGGTATQAAAEGETDGVSARDKFTALVNTEAAKGIPRAKAVANVVAQHPEIQAAMLAEAKASVK